MKDCLLNTVTEKVKNRDVDKVMYLSHIIDFKILRVW